MALFKNKSAGMSLPRVSKIHGIEIKKVPIGQYIAAMREMEDLPSVIISELFPGQNMAEIISGLTSADEGFAISLLGKLLVVLPERLVEAVCEILSLDNDMVMNTLTPNELLDVLKEFWELNDLTDFFKSVSGLLKIKLPAQKIGSSDGLPSEKASE